MTLAGFPAARVQTWSFGEPGWIEAYRGGGTVTGRGTYKISVIVRGPAAQRADQISGNKALLGASTWAPHTGWVERDDRDWFRVDLIDGKVYHFDVEGGHRSRLPG